MKIFYFGILLMIFSAKSQAQDGSLDPSFGNNGIITTYKVGYSNSDICVQPDGKILLTGGSYDFVVMRFNIDGSIDSTFNNDGVVVTDIDSLNQSANVICLQPDGKILVAGWHVIPSTGANAVAGLLIRYNANGSVDSTFGFDGIVFVGYDYSPNEIMLQTDGKIVLGGSSTTVSSGISTSEIMLIRLDSDGHLDSSFDSDGIVTTYFGTFPACGVEGMTLQPDGKILVAGHSKINQDNDFLIARYNTDGSFDTTFNNIGYITTDINNSKSDYANDIVLQPDGKILVTGYTWYENYFVVARYHSNGSLDLSFDSDGIVTTLLGSNNTIAYNIALQPNGKILVAGYSGNGADYYLNMVRYNTDGSLDSSFDSDGIVMSPLVNVTPSKLNIDLQSDGKILLSSNFIDTLGVGGCAILRYNNSLIPIVSIEKPMPNLLIYPNPFRSTTTIEFGADVFDSELVIYNMFGQKVKTISNISDSMILLNREGLATGFYVISLIQNNKVIATDKIVITD